MLVLDYATLRYDWNDEYGMKTNGWMVHKTRQFVFVEGGNGTGGRMMMGTEISRPGQGQGDRHDALCMGGEFVIRSMLFFLFILLLSPQCVHIMGR